MLYKQIIKSLIILFSPVMCFSQNSQFCEEFIAYRFPKEVDSLLTIKLDSIKSETIENNMVVLIQFNCMDEHSNYNCIFYLDYLSSYRNDTIHFYQYLARNSNRYFVSNNKHFKIPVVLLIDDNTFKYDNNKYPFPISDSPSNCLIMIRVRESEIVKVDFNNPIPKSARKY